MMMCASLIVSLGCLVGLVGAGDDERPDAGARAEYQARRQAAGEDAEAHLGLAIWCEARGLELERVRELARTVQLDPDNPRARSLLGQVRDPGDGRWVRAEDAVDAARSDAGRAEARAEYETRRVEIEDTPEAHWNLAIWCEQAGLEGEARAHLARVTMLDPAREAAWKRLGYKKVNGVWMTEGQLAAARVERSLQKAADTRWSRELDRLVGQLGDSRKREEAQAGLAAIRDPRSVPVIWRKFVLARKPNPVLAARLLGQIDSRDASRALALLTIGADDAEAHRVAAENLRQRDPREFADILIRLVREPIKYEVKPVAGPGSAGELWVEGKDGALRRIYQAPASAYTQRPGDFIAGYDENGQAMVARSIGRQTVETNSQLLALLTFRPPFSTHGASRLIEQANQGGRPELAKALGMLAASPGIANFSSQPQSRPTMFGNGGVAGNFPFSPVWTMFSGGEVPFGTSLGDIVTYESYSGANPGSYWSFNLDQLMLIPVGRADAEAFQAAKSSQQQLERDVARLDLLNALFRRAGERVLPLLRDVSGLDVGQDQDQWMSWYVDQMGYRLQAQRANTAPGVVTEIVPPSYIPRPVQVEVVSQITSYRRVSCFGPGTPVHTRDGLKPIEEVRVGDVVLSLDVHSGELSFQPVTAVHHNPPSPTRVVRVGDEGELITASTYHRFWRPGVGWSMARDLEAGETLRGLEGLTTIDGVDEGETMPVFNLDVAGGHTFFVGRSALLVHDNTLPDIRSEPFDAVGEVERANSSADDADGHR